jgi:hypothetical protein
MHRLPEQLTSQRQKGAKCGWHCSASSSLNRFKKRVRYLEKHGRFQPNHRRVGPLRAEVESRIEAIIRRHKREIAKRDAEIKRLKALLLKRKKAKCR